MNITGIIAEYNPFHNGHKYQLEQAKLSCDAVVVVMSGNFVQRGDVAVFDKWTRTKYALLNGADLVIELPVCYALNSAERFAYGGVNLLNSLGIVDNICFGSECGDIELLKKSAYLLDNEPSEVSDKIKKLLDKGQNYPSAREKAFANHIPPAILSEPNNILALEYIRHLHRLSSPINPVTVKRHMVGHNCTCANKTFASATAIRSMLQNNSDISEYIPYTVDKSFTTYDLSRLDTAMAAHLRLCTKDFLANINDVSEGLENRIISAAQNFSSIREIAENIKTKRYTMSRINRILLSALLGLDKNLCTKPPEYIRILGMNKLGRQILSLAKKRASLPIITKTAKFDLTNDMLKKDILATDIAALCADNPKMRISNKDFLTSPIILM